MVTELNVVGTVYEQGEPDSAPYDKIYGVRLDKVVWPKGFIATVDWHGKAADLEPVQIKEKRKR